MYLVTIHADDGRILAKVQCTTQKEITEIINLNLTAVNRIIKGRYKKRYTQKNPHNPNLANYEIVKIGNDARFKREELPPPLPDLPPPPVPEKFEN